jgi:uncharacterized protein (DUF1015 family)
MRDPRQLAHVERFRDVRREIQVATVARGRHRRAADPRIVARTSERSSFWNAFTYSSATAPQPMIAAPSFSMS